MQEKKKKLDVDSILSRLSDGAMFGIKGGQSNSDAGIDPSVKDCLAGCCCDGQRACDVCVA